MLLLIVVHEARDGVVVTTGEHAAGGLLLLDWKCVNTAFWLVTMM
jgi:hypothetical protein